jgi:hypothetical protein
MKSRITRTWLGRDITWAHTGKSWGMWRERRRRIDWFVDGPRNYLQDWIGHPETFDDAQEVTLIGRAIDRWATLTMAYQHELRLHDVVLNMFVRAYDQIDRGYWPAHLAAAESFYSHDDPPSAADELQQAMKANPGDAGAWLLFGRMELGAIQFRRGGPGRGRDSG